MKLEGQLGKVSEVDKIAAAARRLDDQSAMDWRKINRTAGDIRRDIRRHRVSPVRRVWLLSGQVEEIIKRINEDIAFTFLLQAALMLRYASLREVYWSDVSITPGELGPVFNIVVRHEKAPSDVGVRVIRGLPRNMGLIKPRSRLWTPVMHELERRKRWAVAQGEDDTTVIRQEWAAEVGGYERYNKAVRACITRWTGNNIPLTTHDARRTGACLHHQEGWSMRLIALVGGWSLVDHTSLIKYLGFSLDVMSLAKDHQGTW